MNKIDKIVDKKDKNISPRVKYADLLPLRPDYELELFVSEFDRLCNSKQPPPSLANLSIANSWLARQAESSTPLSFGEKLKAELAQNLPLRRSHRFSLTRRRKFMALTILLLLGGLIFTIERFGPKSIIYDISQPPPICNKPAKATNQGALRLNFGCTDFSIQDVTADADRVKVEYLLNVYKPVGLHLTDEQGHELKYVGGTSTFSKGQHLEFKMPSPNPKWPSYNGANPGGEAWFDASALDLKNGSTSLHLVIDSFQPNFNGKCSQADEKCKSLSTPLGGPFSFELGLNLKSQMTRTAVLNQSDSVNGEAIVLEKVAVMPDATRFYLRGWNLNDQVQYELRAGTELLSGYMSGYNIDSDIVTTEEGLTVITLNTTYSNASLLNQAGEWTLIVKAIQADTNSKQSIAQTMRGPWIFRFTPPPAATSIVGQTTVGTSKVGTDEVVNTPPSFSTSGVKASAAPAKMLTPKPPSNTNAKK